MQKSFRSMWMLRRSIKISKWMPSVIGDVKEVLKRLLEEIPKKEHPGGGSHYPGLKSKYPLNYDPPQLTGPYIIEKLYELTNW